ncbi:MAG TPA: transcriptional regulator [Fibrobacteres bacterium]|jgi:Rrf2 family protein|nr:transcriptional regulator [Fibrobacterota bacterium]
MISMRTKYALKALIYLAKTKDRGPVLIGEIAESQKLPRKFLEQILLELKNMKILKSRRGKNGGYYLGQDPKKIAIGKIVRTFNGPLALVPCVSATAFEKCEECLDFENCGIRRVMKKVRDITAEILDGASLETLVAMEFSESDEAALMFAI